MSHRIPPTHANSSAAPPRNASEQPTTPFVTPRREHNRHTSQFVQRSATRQDRIEPMAQPEGCWPDIPSMLGNCASAILGCMYWCLSSLVGLFLPRLAPTALPQTEPLARRDPAPHTPRQTPRSASRATPAVENRLAPIQEQIDLFLDLDYFFKELKCPCNFGACILIYKPDLDEPHNLKFSKHYQSLDSARYQRHIKRFFSDANRVLIEHDISISEGDVFEIILLASHKTENGEWTATCADTKGKTFLGPSSVQDLVSELNSYQKGLDPKMVADLFAINQES